MLLIADSGSTKTDWLLIQDKKIVRKISTVGLNPFFETVESVYSKIENKFSISEKKMITEIYFYGAGCIKGINSDIIETAFKRVFSEAIIDAQDDMLGAARALFGQNSGIACILGTGANSCKYEQGKIVDKVPTLGYILGDEASGAYLGRKLLNHYFKRKLPFELSESLKKQFNPVQVDVQDAVYKEKNPNRYMASFAPFLAEYKENEYVKKFLVESFEDFFESNVLQYENYSEYQLGFIGSIAYYFSDVLNIVAESKGLKISLILKKPIDALVNFHSQNI